MPGQPVSPLSELYQRHHGWLFGWLRKKLGCPDNAADLTQDTFVKLLGLEHLPAFKEPRAFLLVAANRLLINQYHRAGQPIAGQRPDRTGHPHRACHRC